MASCHCGEVFDAIVIGTGFAGAATAARLVQAGQRICVLERGRKFEPYDFPMYPNVESLQRIDGGRADDTEGPDLARWFWAVDQGLYDIRDLDDVIAVQAAGYGGGSLIYANVHLRAPADVFEQGWPKVYRRKWLDRFYDLAACMLDVQPMPRRVAKTEQLERAATHLGRRDDWFRPPLAVHFPEEGDNRFDEKWVNRWQREQGKCDLRGQCWLGCRAQAKNTLDLNYLAIVEDAKDDKGPLADIRTLAEVCRIERAPCDCGARFAVHYRDRLVATGDLAQNGQEVCRTRYVFLCAGAVNSTELLLGSRDLLDREVGQRLGSRYHPNADWFAAVFDCDEPQEADLGPTITSALLYRGPPDRGSQAAPEGADDQLWALEFLTGDALGDDVAPGLEAGAGICCGATRLRLVHEPLFDFGSFACASSRGMLVAVGDGASCRAGTALSGPGGQPAFGKLVADARPLEDWLLVEDGGYPTDIEPLIGVLRSPLWLRRNRYLWQEPVGQQQAGSSDAAVPPKDAGRGRAGPATQRARQAVDLRLAGTSRFPLPTAVAAFRGLPKRVTREPFASALASAQPLRVGLDDLLPPWLRGALARDRTQFAEAVAPLVSRFIETLLDDVADQLNRRFDIETVASRFGSSVQDLGTLEEHTKITLIRGLLRQAIQVLWGSEVALAQRANDLLLQNLPKDLQGWANLLAPLLGWLLDYRPGDGHTAILLVMGRDRYRGRLARPGGRLTARLPAPAADPSRLVHERLLRDIAGIWRGELRTNPAWTFLKRRVTVHSQGGCPMSADPHARVTRHTGEVIGCPGLYVMDAAAFPTAVGVNPSATILAVAEYKIARFIEKELRVPPGRVPTDAEVQTWLKERYPDPRALDPMDQRMPPTPLRARPLAMTFKESMTGLFSEIGPDRSEQPIDWDTLRDFDRAKIASFELAERRAIAERRGIANGRLITTDLTARIGDLERFLRLQRQGVGERVTLKGTVDIEGERWTVSADSYLQFFLDAPPEHDAPLEPDQPMRFFRYRICLTRDGRKRVIEAAKVLCDDPRFDVWHDLSTLYFDVFDGNPEVDAPSRRGIMRLAPVDFVEKQLRSIVIEPEDVDPSRKSWAYFAFVRYFAGEVAGIYLQRPDLAKDLLRSVINAPHGH